MGNSDNVIGYIEYLSDDGKIIGYVTPFTDVDKFRKEILKAHGLGRAQETEDAPLILAKAPA